MRLYLAGSNSYDVEGNAYEQGVYKLYSILHELPGIKRYHRRYPDRDLMVDSGAHTWNKIKINPVGLGSTPTKLPDPRQFLEDYEQLIADYADKPMVFIEFDVYGTLRTREIDAAHQRALQTLDGQRASFMRVYHLVLDGGDLSVLRQWMDEGADYIGIGAECEPIFPKIFHLTQDRVKLHCFAMTRHDVLSRFPFYSVDSTSVIAGIRYGGVVNENFQYIARYRAVQERDMRVQRASRAKIKQAVEAAGKFQRYYTELWAARGVTWDD